ncbi:response regulator [Sphingobacteriaceae bacterium]|nr:response regulator [Sphingobacteriaceae bacterium]
MNSPAINLLLADDDSDDCLFFREALDELPLDILFSSVHDGEQLMSFLSKNTQHLPSILFLDLNMPRKNGFECLTEIKNDAELKKLPVVVFSTSFDPETINSLYENGAHYYIRKPAEFSKLKKVINDAIYLSTEKNAKQPSKENFIIQA